MFSACVQMLAFRRSLREESLGMEEIELVRHLRASISITAKLLGQDSL